MDERLKDGTEEVDVSELALAFYDSWREFGQVDGIDKPSEVAVVIQPGY
ncbi:MAG: hypothetical protein ACFCD0_30055 [Gemmataceae bacterium]